VIRYHEGAEVGYRWFHRTGAKPTYAFGHGLSYTDFAYADLRVEGGDTVTAAFTVTNTDARDGADVPQFYVTDTPGEKRMRLFGFERVELRRIAGGAHRVMLGRSADAPVLTAEVVLRERLFGR
jgi:beta-glucosidase